MLLLYFIVAGLLVGRLAGGRIDAIAEVKFRWWWLALGGLLLQAVLFAPAVAAQVGSAGPALYVASTVAVLVSLLRNVGMRGFAVIAIGAGLNLLAIAANGGYMPSSPEAWQALNGVAALPTSSYTNSALAGSATAFSYLGDILVLPRPLPFANVFSLGDMLIGVGAAWFLVWTMRRPLIVARIAEASAAASRARLGGGPAGQPGDLRR
jgi:hypothetical protein